MTTTTLERREQPGVAAPAVAPGERAVAAPASQMPNLMAVHAAVLACESFAEAAVAFAEGVATRFAFDRVSVGIRNAALVEVEAVSGHAPDAIPAHLAAELAAAMSEAISQRSSLIWPSRQGPVQPRIALAHSGLARRSGGSVCTIPLVASGTVFGALCLERHAGRAIEADEQSILENVACLSGPVLELIRLREQPLVSRVFARWSQRRSSRPGAIVKPLGYGAAALAFAAASLIPLDYHIGGHARLEGAVQRVLVAPADGFLKIAHARPGDPVKAGQVVVELAEQDLQLERRKVAGQLAQHENAYAAANARADRTQMVAHHARASEARAQLALLDNKLDRTRIVAPFDGVVIQGDLSQSLGAPVQQGAELMTIAPSDRFRVIVEVDERDVALVKLDQTGAIALSAIPGERLPIQVARITPLAGAVDGRNVFEVEAALVSHPADLRPGLKGSAKILVGERSLVSAWTRRVVDWTRLFLWSLLG